MRRCGSTLAHSGIAIRDDEEVTVEPNEIFELIIKADEKIKYAKPGKGDLRAGQARELLEQARDAAREIDNDALVTQAERRLADLETLAGEPDPG
jgi:hypothetical protein